MPNPLMSKILPCLYRELESLFGFSGHCEQERQLPSLEVVHWKHGGNANSVEIHTTAAPPAASTDGREDWDVIHLNSPTGTVLVEVDSLGKITAIEVSDRPDVLYALEQQLVPAK